MKTGNTAPRTSGKVYDVVIVGAGISGAILAKQLSRAGKEVLILESGRATSLDPDGYRSYVENFLAANAKVPNSPYPPNPNSPSASVLDVTQIPADGAANNGYMVQDGKLPFSSDYLRARGGTTLHWLGTTLRMLPNDFQLRTRYGQGVDWPFGYEELDPYYEQAEWEIGVSANTEDQELFGIRFRPGYRYPMQRIPPSYLDQVFGSEAARHRYRFGNEEVSIGVGSTPQGRNSIPNLVEGSNKTYQPQGMIGEPTTGQRCEGNASCVPICPVQAKYNALKTLKAAAADRVTVQTQAVATAILTDHHSGRVTGIQYQSYQDENFPPSPTPAVAVGRVYVIAANAIETAKLCLASGVANSSDQMGRNLTDHPTLLTWGLAPQNVGAFRGPGSTSNIFSFRDGEFRAAHSAFIVPLDNWGWGWSAFAPGVTLSDWVYGKDLFGADLRSTVADQIPRQITLQFEFEQPPDPLNTVTIDKQYRDQMGCFRPIITYNLPAYVRDAMEAACDFSADLFGKLNIQPFTQYNAWDPGYFEHNGRGYSFRGAGHLAGTHRMGSSADDSVVDPDQRTWDHDNLYLVGCGSMPTVGTSNPTLTMVALAFRSAEAILRDLE
jgi:choline dehydrogenase-like flavoprotein